MTVKKIREQLNKLDKCFESHNATDNRDAYVSFTMDSIGRGDSDHRLLSDLVYSADVSTDYAYTWLWETIDALTEILNKGEESEEIDKDYMLDDFYSFLPEEVYTYEHGKFIASHSWALDDAINQLGASENDNLGMAYRYAQEQQCYSFADSVLDYIFN